MFTALHRAVGVRPDHPLNGALVARAIAEQVAENDELDWKQQIPRAHPQQPPPHPAATADEVAKDLAAMANSGGGVIVFGVAEDGTGAASRLVPLHAEADVELRLRQIAFAHIRPALTNVRFELLDIAKVGEEAGGKVLVALIGRSHDAPHLVWTKDGAFKAPKRYGASTITMTDDELERAYRIRSEARELRIEHRRDDLQVLRREHTPAPQVIEDNPPWFFGIARPLDPGIVERDVDRDAVARAFHRAAHRCASLADEPPTPWVDSYDRVSRRRRGWTWRPVGGDLRFIEQSITADGGVSLTRLVGGAPAAQDDRLQDGQVPVMWAERCVLLLACLVEAAGHELGQHGPWVLTLTLARHRPGEVEFMYEDSILSGRFNHMHVARPVDSFLPSEAVLSLPASDAQLLEAARDLTVDLTAQAGIDRVYLFDAPPA